MLGLENVTGALNQLELRNNQDADQREHRRVFVRFVVDFSLC